MSCRKSYQNFLLKQVKRELTKMITFSPPSPPRYTIIPSDRCSMRGNQYTHCEFIPTLSEDKDKEKDIDLDTDSSTPKSDTPPQCFNPYPWINIECYQLRKTDSKNKIICLIIHNTSVPKDKKNTIIYSHGNSSDLGSLYSSLIDIASILRCDVMAYDYTGYGQSEGVANERDIYSDIDQVLDFALAYKQIALEKIILFGSSIGSVPSVSIASSPKFCGVKGCILLSPIASGNNLINYTNSNLECINDVFNTVSLAKEIICPVFVVHGKLDNVIPIEHSYDIVKELKNSMTWYPNKATHSNLATLYRQKYYAKLKTFLKYVEDNYSKVNRIRLDSISQSKLDSTVIDLLCLKK